jgi:dTDP-4-amino-4,6-dideoxygalactose transaminase
MQAAVPFNDLRRMADEVRDQLALATNRVIESGQYLLGPETDAFEHAFAVHCSVAGCVAVANGTDALEISLRSVGCGPGDEVIVAANAGAYATTACLAIGATPVFPDIDPRTLLVRPERMAAMVGPKTRAVVCTHLYGNVVDVDAVRRLLPARVAVVEDCAQAHGASLRGRPVGSLGDVAAFSFYPTKNLGALGDAGAVVSSRPDLLARAQALRQYGWGSRYQMLVPGGRNSRIDELQAAVLLALLPHLAERNQRRAHIRRRYVEGLHTTLDFVSQSPGAHPVVHLCVARAPDRDTLIGRLESLGVMSAVHFPVADHQQPALRDVAFRHDGLTETVRACDDVMSLPCFPELRDDEVDRVIEAVRKAA